QPPLSQLSVESTFANDYTLLACELRHFPNKNTSFARQATLSKSNKRPLFFKFFLSGYSFFLLFFPFFSDFDDGVWVLEDFFNLLWRHVDAIFMYLFDYFTYPNPDRSRLRCSG